MNQNDVIVHFYDVRLAKAFAKAVPYLAARGAPVKKGTPEELHDWLEEWLSRPLNTWAVRTRLPIMGSWYKIPLGGSGQERVRIQIGDARAFTRNREELTLDDDNNALVFVENVFGLCVKPGSGAWVSPPPLEADVLRDADLVALSGGGVTALAEVFPNRFDAFYLCDIWADEMLPEIIRKFKPRDAFRPAIQREPHLLTDEYSFTTDCPECDASGKVDCHVCDGEGTETCGLCGGSGDVECRRCDGTGNVTCKKCGGSGRVTLRNGNRVSCNPCDGSGVWDCLSCDGSGERDCPRCDGSGEVDCRYCKGDAVINCRKCRGFGQIQVRWSGGKWVVHSQNDEPPVTVPSKQVALFDFNTGEKTSLPGDKSKTLLSRLVETLERNRRSQQKFDHFAAEFTPIATCLQNSMDAEADDDDAEPLVMALGAPDAALERVDNAVVYSFPILEHNFKGKQKKNGKAPAPGAPVNLDPQPQFAEGTVVRGQARLQALDFNRKSVSIAFPAEIGKDSIPENMKASFSKPPQAEKAQLHLLKKWLDPRNIDHPIMAGMLMPRSHALDLSAEWQTPGELPTPKQNEAFRHAVGSAPLTLIQGPPGTGKTHVIVNMVLHAAKRGQRILVTSQTHQAVANVLEKIDSLYGGSIPMLRHARDKSKLSETELRYTSSIAPSGIAAAVNRTSEKYSEEAMRLLAVLGNLDAAARTAGDLEAAREKCKNETTACAAALGNDLERAENAAEAGKTQLRKRVADKTAAKNKEQQTLAAKRASAAANNGKLTQRVNEIRRRLGANVGPAPKSSGGFFDSVLDFGASLLPDFMSSTGTLRQRLEEAVQKSKAEQRKLRDFDSQLGEIAAALNALRQEERDGCDGFDRELADKTATLKSEYAARQGKIEEEWLEANIAARRSFDKLWVLALEEVSDADPRTIGKAQWDEAADKVRRTVAGLERRIKYCDKWRDEIEKHPGALAQFLDERTAVFFSTCVGLAGWRELKRYDLDGPAAFDMVIVDEAGHATIPETVIPLYAGRKAVLIGDTQQLPPIVGENNLDCYEKRRKGNVSACVAKDLDLDCWLERSLFSRLWSDPGIAVPKTMLDVQFRMHPDIGAFISDTFYEGKLSNGVSDADRSFAFGRFQKPLCLVSTSEYGNRYEEDAGTSKRNQLEADQIVNIVRELVNREQDGQQLSLGVISAYKAQSGLIDRKLKEFQGHPRLNFQPGDISTVDRFQGAERDIIIVSFARSPKPCPQCEGGKGKNASNCPRCHGRGYLGGGLRFVHDLKRMNVAFSRARKMLILVGDIVALCNARGEESGREALRRFHGVVSDKGRVLRVYTTTDSAQ